MAGLYLSSDCGSSLQTTHGPGSALRPIRAEQYNFQGVHLVWPQKHMEWAHEPLCGCAKQVQMARDAKKSWGYPLGCQTPPIPLSALEKDPRPGPLFEGNPVGEGTTRMEPVHCSMFSSNCCFLTCTQVSQEAGKVAWYSHHFKSFLQFIVIHTKA